MIARWKFTNYAPPGAIFEEVEGVWCVRNGGNTHSLVDARSMGWVAPESATAPDDYVPDTDPKWDIEIRTQDFAPGTGLVAHIVFTKNSEPFLTIQNVRSEDIKVDPAVLREMLAELNEK